MARQATKLLELTDARDAAASAQPTPWFFEAVNDFEGYNVEWASDDERLLISAGRHLFLHKPGEPLWHFGALPLAPFQQAIVASRSLQRSMAAAFTNVIPMSGRAVFVSFGERVYAMRDGIARELAGLARPTRIWRGGCALTTGGRIYFGEWLPNRRRGPVRIYCWEAGWPRVEVAHTFSAGSVRHIHGVFSNPYDDSLWCLTGDQLGECRILRSTDEFRTADVVGSGDETWRAATLQFTADTACYAMAAEWLSNKVFCFDMKSGRRQEIGELNGPAYYASSRGNDVFFSVAATTCRSRQDDAATLWWLDAKHSLHKLLSFGRDRWPTSRAMPRALHFASSAGSSVQGVALWCSGTGLRGADQKTFVGRRRHISHE